MEDNNHIIPDCMRHRFPETAHEKSNPAIQLYGLRFYKDQTPVEYLAELLLVFSSPKSDGQLAYSFKIAEASRTPPCYWPKNRLALKLFAFFPSSILETRHPTHQKAYRELLEALKSCIKEDYPDDRKEETIRLLQSLFSGFVGVAKNRTWVTHAFLPVANELLAREIIWSPQDSEIPDTWNELKSHFRNDRHNFMARGGEALFLQLANLFANPNSSDLQEMLKSEIYQHIGNHSVAALEDRLQQQLRQMLEEAVSPLANLTKLLENKLSDYEIDLTPRHANLGWVPAVSRIEGLLFAHEMDNICSANISSLEKLALLQTLCSMQVLRSLCFQASRLDDAELDTPGFIGNYAWIAADPEATTAMAIRQMAQSSFNRIEALLYRVLRNKALADCVRSEKNPYKEADKNGFEIFRKIAKDTGLVIPRKGSGQRFVITPELLRFLVAALIPPGKRIRLTEFYNRAFAHYGLALGGQALANAFVWNSGKANTGGYTVPSADADWIVETLRQGGFLVELSDAVSIVHNPG
jgi:hypothetical protein